MRQNEPLIKDLRFLTIGLEDSSQHRNQVIWSLPLAYMRYYGEPTLITGSVVHSNVRITMDQFTYIVLGSMIVVWERAGFVPDPSSAVNILQKFPDFLEEVCAKRDAAPLNETEDTRSMHFLSKTSWRGQILTAVDMYEFRDDVERKTAMKLVSLRRRHPDFLCPQDLHPVPLFGLSRFRDMLGIMRDSNLGLAFLRQVVSSLNLSSNRYVIRYKYKTGVFEYATISTLESDLAHDDGFVSRTNNVPWGKNVRWLRIPVPNTNQKPCKCKNSCVPTRNSNGEIIKQKKKCKCQPHGCSSLCHDWRKTKISSCGRLYDYQLASRSAEVASCGGQCLPVQWYPTDSYNSTSDLLDFGTGTDLGSSLKEMYIGKL